MPASWPLGTIAIGDEVRDIEAARAAGIACAAVTWGYAAASALVAMKPELVFESMNDIAARLTPQATPPLLSLRHALD